MTRAPTRVRHKKRGSEYLVLGEGELQISTAFANSGRKTPALSRVLGDGAKLVVYRGEGGKLWLRPPDEFDDGRFEPARTPENNLREELARVLEIVARDGLGQPRDLDAALDAIGAALAARADEVVRKWETDGSAEFAHYVRSGLDETLEDIA